MSNSEYIKAGAGTFASAVALDAPLGLFDTVIPYTRARFTTTTDPVRVGMAVMVDYEIMGVTAVGVGSITVARGCADTIPATHPTDSVAWIFDASSAGSDYVERSAGDTVAVKISPYTIGGGNVPPETIKPISVDLNWRFFRPYPPGRMRVNDMPWSEVAALNTDIPALHLTWRHRDRVTQADKLIPHEADSTGPEPGTTYTMRVVNPGGDVVRTEVGIQGAEFFYRYAQALNDLGSQMQTAHIQFTSNRDGLDAWQEYDTAFILAPGSIGAVPYLAFSHRVIEAPYVVNAKRGVGGDSNHAVAMAARPADRMADYWQLYGNGALAQDPGVRPFTPWVTSDFRLPELEITINIRTSSFFDGVALNAVRTGDMALIDDEIVQLMAIGPGLTLTVRRGCCDTVPAVHVAGSRVWLFGTVSVFDSIDRADGETVEYKARPISYGAPHDLETLPANSVTYGRRAELPYPPGRVVVNGRPWFEPAQAVSGSSVIFSWAWRNRITQGSGVYAHDDVSQGAEAGQYTRLRFYYETPPEAEGSQPVQHVLRQVDVDTAAVFSYTYAMALVDGLAAGSALGICGTVTILCRLSSVRAGLESLQSYITLIRVPSFPC